MELFRCACCKVTLYCDARQDHLDHVAAELGVTPPILPDMLGLRSLDFASHNRELLTQSSSLLVWLTSSQHPSN